LLAVSHMEGADALQNHDTSISSVYRHSGAVAKFLRDRRNGFDGTAPAPLRSFTLAQLEGDHLVEPTKHPHSIPLKSKNVGRYKAECRLD
jgi:hypothetical protein